MTDLVPGAPAPWQTPFLRARNWLEDYLPYFDLVSNLVVIFVAAGFVVSLLVFFRSRRNDRSSVFLALRNDYAAILETLQREVPDYDSPYPLTRYTSLPQDGRKALRRYWVHSLNEYIINNVLHPKDSLRLWRDFYARAQSTALDMPLLRAALDDLITDENYSFGGHKEAYLSALERAYDTHRPGSVALPRDRTGAGDPATADRHAGDAAGLTRDILRKLRDSLGTGRIAATFRDLVDEAETLCSADDSPAYQAECLAACLALEAAAEGDFGVGAVLADAEWRVLGMAKNTVFSSRDPSHHAEMNIISDHHIGPPGDREKDAALRRITLVTSLEPCPMCLSRISMTPLEEILYLARDPEGGMVAHKDHMPQVWRSFLRDKRFRLTAHAPLEAFSRKVFETTRDKDATFLQ